MKVIRNSVWALGLLLSLLSCDKNREFDAYQSLGGRWHRDSLAVFNYQVKDTLTPYDLFINLRANSSYEFSNIYLIASIESPSQRIKVDTLEYLMAAPDGRLLGNGGSDIKESKLWLKENYRFSETGPHKITIEQALRKRNQVEGLEYLEGILDVGFRIEKNQKN